MVRGSFASEGCVPFSCPHGAQRHGLRLVFFAIGALEPPCVHAQQRTSLQRSSCSFEKAQKLAVSSVAEL